VTPVHLAAILGIDAVGLALWILLSFALSEHSDAWAKLLMVSGIWVNALSALAAVVLYAMRRREP